MCSDKAQRWRENKTVKAKNWTHFSLQFGGIMINSKRENIIIKLKLSLTNCFCQTWILIFAPEGYIWKPFWIPTVYNTVSFLKYKIHIQWGRKNNEEQNVLIWNWKGEAPIRAQWPSPTCWAQYLSKITKGWKARNFKSMCVPWLSLQ